MGKQTVWILTPMKMTTRTVKTQSSNSVRYFPCAPFLGEVDMQSLIKASAVLLLAIFFAACSNPRDRFVSAALGGEKVSASERALMECVADRLQKKLRPDEFAEITEDLIKINKKGKTPLEANLKLMGMMAVARLACAI